MSADITKDRRSRGWNTKFFVGSRAFAGVYQRDDFLTVGDVARDLDLCIIFQIQDRSADDWQPVLIPQRPTSDPRRLGHIALDQSDNSPFPAPSVDSQYTYLFHSATLCRQPHAPASRCYHQPQKPTRRFHPRYAAIGKRPPANGRLVMAPLRSSKGTKRTSSSSPTPSRNPSTSGLSVSSLPSEIENEEIPVAIVKPETARALMAPFRANILDANSVCAISGEGKSWLSGLTGTGLEAAHIVPQLHWSVYPIASPPGNPSDSENMDRLEEAWRQTWLSTNGLPLLATYHKCFESRLVSIHPQTRRIRAFVDFDVINKYHGKPAFLPPHELDPEALQHHHDMCCIENMIAAWVVDAPTPAPQWDPMSVIPQQGDLTPAGSQDAPSGTVAASQYATTRSAPASQDTSKFAPTTHPPSPPSSDTGRGHWVWEDPVGNDPQIWEMTRYGFVQKFDDPSGEDEDEDEERGRPSKRRRCTATESDGDDEEWRVLKKKKRLPGRLVEDFQARH